MKTTLRYIATLLIFLTTFIHAETIWSTGAYTNNEDRSQTLSVANASKLTVTVSGVTEANYDYMYIYDANGNEIKKLHGNINETFTVNSGSIRARFTSDRSQVRSGVTVTVVAANTSSEIHIGDWIRTNPGAGGTINMIGATASGILLTASDLSGVYISEDNGLNWNPLGETNGLLNTHISALGFHPTNSNTFYVGTGSGVYKTTNKGQNFNFITSLPYGENNDTYVQSIVISNANPKPIYITYHEWDTNSPSKIVKSIDDGQTWSDISIGTSLTTSRLRIVKLLVHPNNANLIYAISGKPRWGCSPAKAYRSTNGGANWSLLENKGDVLDLDIDFSDDNILYMSTFSAKPCQPVGEDDFSISEYVLNGGTGKLYKSTNQGTSFGEAVLNQTGIISAGTTNANNIKLINILTMKSAWWKGDEQTGTWESNSAGEKNSWNHIGSVSNWDTGYAKNTYSSLGYAFNGLNKTLTKDIFNSDRLYGANGWTMATFDGGKTFNSLSTQKVGTNTWKSTGLENIEGFALDVNDNDTSVIYMGGYDIGFWVSRDRGLSWKWQNPYKGDDSKLVEQNRYTWGATEDTSNPTQFQVIGGSNVMTLLSDPSNANVVWSSFARAQAFDDADVNGTVTSKSDRSGLFRSIDYGDTWTLSLIYKLNGTVLNTHYHARIYGLSVDKSSSSGNRVLYVTIDGHVAKSTDDGRTWHIIHEDGGLKFTAVSNGILYAGGSHGLWRFKNNIWTQMGGNFQIDMMGIGSPMIPDLTPQENETHYDANWNKVIDRYAWNGVHDIKIDPTNTNIVYVVVYGQDAQNNSKGLYKTTDGGDSWSRVSLGVFENKYLRGITINPQNPNNIFVVSSESINSGGTGGTSKGVIYSNDAGTTWHEANGAMAWKYASTIEVDSANERVWAWSPGTGLQYAEIR